MAQSNAAQLLESANAHHQAGRLDEAERAYREALKLDPHSVQAMNNLAIALARLGRSDEAEKLWRDAIAVQPNYASAMNNLALMLVGGMRLLEAAELWERVLLITPDDFDAHLNLGAALDGLYRSEQAAAHFRQAALLHPRDPRAHSNLGLALAKMGRLKDAQAAHERAIDLAPNDPAVLNAAANAQLSAGRVREACELFRRALSIHADFAIHSNLLGTLHYDPDVTPDELFTAHRAWADAHADPLSRDIQPHANDCDPNRRLRIGYVSSDFRRHAVATFFEPLLANHDHENFEIFCYSSVLEPDEVTQRLRAHADVWRDVGALSNTRVAELIRDDRIDILLDLSGHISRHRLLIFARKPAPIQVTYLGYPDTTGMTQIDYRFTDALHDPIGATESFHTEKLVRLAPSAWCYRPSPNAPEVNTREGPITFGSMNNIFKVSEFAADVWSRILNRLPDSRLMILALGAEDAAELTFERLTSRGVARDRIDVVGKTSPDEYLKLYHRIDVALDPFPYNGHTTTLDSLWMGVPVITLAGNTHVSRAGVSVLTNVGLPELIADSADRYVQIVVDLVEDRSRLRDLRAMLREKMQTSPLHDEMGFAGEVERAYRTMWQSWCAS